MSGRPRKLLQGVTQEVRGQHEGHGAVGEEKGTSKRDNKPTSV